jgi:DHA1 family tetracycline resistance protein-like MFS transporter
LLATRVLGGALASNVSVGNAYVADITPPKDRAKSFGLIGAAFGVGFILGPMLGGLVGGVDIRLPFFTAAGLSLLNFAYGLFVLPESLPLDRRRPVDLRKANPFAALVGLARLKTVGMLVTVIALSNLAQYTIHGTWVLFMTFRFGWGPPENGISFFVVGLTSALVQGVLLGRLLQILGERRLVLAGLASGTVAFLAYGIATEGWMIYVIVVANVLAFGVPAALNAVISRAADPREQGLAMGSLSSLNSLVAVIAPLFAVPLFARVSHLPRSDVWVGAPFFLASALSTAALALAAWHFSRTADPAVAAMTDAESR